jgi:hypothetical protein
MSKKEKKKKRKSKQAESGRKPSKVKVNNDNQIMIIQILPLFWFAKVNIVNAVEIHVFCVPCKTRFPHSKVEIRGVNTKNLSIGRVLDEIKDSTKF